MKVRITEEQFKGLMKEMIKESYPFRPNVTFDIKDVDIWDAMPSIPDDTQLPMETMPVKISYVFNSSDRGTYDIPPTPASFDFRGCEPYDKEAWGQIVSMSGVPENELMDELTSYVDANLDDLLGGADEMENDLAYCRSEM